MRIVAVLALLMSLAACASKPSMTTCPETRPQVCTLEYAPTCAVLKSGAREEKSSPCNACADDQVVGYEAGACAE